MNEQELYKLYEKCTLCPRGCGVDRFKTSGFCKSPAGPKLAGAMLHMWEEPVLGENNVSGAVFFSGCTLRCVFCQNYEISAGGFGKEISTRELSGIFLSLQEKGAGNIDLITASHYLPSVISALDMAKDKLKIPVVYNCGGYESAEALRQLDGYIDIYLPDIKYYDDAAARKYSQAPGYFDTACLALSEMIRQIGPCVIESGHMRRGVIVRHMVLPSHRKDSIDVLKGLKERFGTDKFLISLLRQYTPVYLAADRPEFKAINRKVTGYEYDSVVNAAAELGFDGFMQEKGSAKEEYTPDFNLEGLP